MNILFRYANPREFMRLSTVLLPVTAVVATLTIAIGLWLGFTAPPDYQQGTTVTKMTRPNSSPIAAVPST